MYNLTGHIMDAIHYCKIADKLICFLGKLPQSTQLTCKNAKVNTQALKDAIVQLLNDIDIYADLDDNGWIR